MSRIFLMSSDAAHGIAPRAHTVVRCLQGGLVAGLLAAAGGASAEPSPALDRISLSAGAFYAEPKIQIGADTGMGRIDSPNEKQDHVTLPRAKADFLLGDSQGISVDYFRYDKSYNPSLSGQTTRDGQLVSGTATVDGKLQLDLAQVAYKWWIGSGNDVFGIGVGAAYYRAKVSGSASGAVQLGGVTTTVAGADKASESAYAPLLELGWRHALTPNVRLYAEASGIKKNGGSINGHIYGGALGVEWFPVKNVGLVLDYGIQKIQLNRDGERSADLNIRLTGPSAFVKVRF